MIPQKITSEEFASIQKCPYCDTPITKELKKEGTQVIVTCKEKHESAIHVFDFGELMGRGMYVGKP